MNYFGQDFSPLFSDLCGLCVFAGDNPSFGCGSSRAVSFVVTWYLLID